MPTEKAGYTVVMFLIDISPSMGNIRTVEVETSPGQMQTVEMTNLEYCLQFVKLKIQEMIFNGRKTDQCGVIVFGSEHTKNIVNDENGDYEHVSEYIPIAQPNANTIAKIDALKPSSVAAIDALIVGIETQNKYLATKKSWTRKIILVTDGESPLEVEDWEVTVAKMNDLHVHLSVVGVDFDDEVLSYTEPNKSSIKRENELFLKNLTSQMDSASIGSCELALRDSYEPDCKEVRSMLMGTTLYIGARTGDLSVDTVELSVKASKATAVTRPKAWKKFILRAKETDPDAMVVEENEDVSVYAPLKMRTEFYIDQNAKGDGDFDENAVKEEDDDALLLNATSQEGGRTNNAPTKYEKEQLIRGFKYGTTYVPCPDGQFLKRPTLKGIEICAFFPMKNFRREWSMGEIQYIWGDPSSAQQQVGLSSIVQAMVEKEVMAIARWVSKDNMDPKMGVLMPVVDNVHYLLWGQMPFAEDLRKYAFASLDTLINKKGEKLSEHPYLPTKEQKDTMDDFVDAMDLMHSGEKDEETGHRKPWFETILSYNPAVHRVKQAMFHCAVVTDITTHPLPPPHPELTKYFDPPAKVVRKAQPAIEACKAAFNVKEVPKRVVKAKKDGHVHAHDDDDGLLLLDRKPSLVSSRSRLNIVEAEPSTAQKRATSQGDDSETEDDTDGEDLLAKKPSVMPTSGDKIPFPTPARSLSPSMDLGRAPGRIVGNTYPLNDFRSNLGQAADKAIEDLAALIKEVVTRPFGDRRTNEMLECMVCLRDTCLKRDKVEVWNNFIIDLKDSLSSKNADIWKSIQGQGNLSLISRPEASHQGSKYGVSEDEAGQFMS